MSQFAVLTLQSVEPGIFDKMVLAIDNAGGLCRFGGFGITDEIPRFFQAADFEQEEDIIRHPTQRQI